MNSYRWSSNSHTPPNQPFPNNCAHTRGPYSSKQFQHFREKTMLHFIVVFHWHISDSETFMKYNIYFCKINPNITANTDFQGDIICKGPRWQAPWLKTLRIRGDRTSTLHTYMSECFPWRLLTLLGHHQRWYSKDHGSLPFMHSSPVQL